MSVDFVSPFDQNLIRSIGVQNLTDAMKVFLWRSLTILEENGNRHKEAMSVASEVPQGVECYYCLC